MTVVLARDPLSTRPVNVPLKLTSVAETSVTVLVHVDSSEALSIMDCATGVDIVRRRVRHRTISFGDGDGEGEMEGEGDRDRDRDREGEGERGLRAQHRDSRRLALPAGTAAAIPAPYSLATTAPYVLTGKSDIAESAHQDTDLAPTDCNSSSTRIPSADLLDRFPGLWLKPIIVEVSKISPARVEDLADTGTGGCTGDGGSSEIAGTGGVSTCGVITGGIDRVELGRADITVTSRRPTPLRVGLSVHDVIEPLSELVSLQILAHGSTAPATLLDLMPSEALDLHVMIVQHNVPLLYLYSASSGDSTFKSSDDFSNISNGPGQTCDTTLGGRFKNINSLGVNTPTPTPTPTLDANGSGGMCANSGPFYSLDALKSKLQTLVLGLDNRGDVAKSNDTSRLSSEADAVIGPLKIATVTFSPEAVELSDAGEWPENVLKERDVVLDMWRRDACGSTVQAQALSVDVYTYINFSKPK